MPSHNNDTVSVRYITIDALRGIAASIVVFFHLYGAIKPSISSWLPSIIGAILSYGYIGVSVFFVISGFVIAHTIRESAITISYIGNFALRRSIRLDPPYWVSIVTAISLTYLSTVIFPDIHRSPPQPGQVISHIFYLQNILGYGDIVAVYWTLCFEVQFYLFFICSLGLFQQFSLKMASSKIDSIKIQAAIFYILGLISILTRFEYIYIPIPGIFIEYWYQFYLGVITYWCVSGQFSQKNFWLFLLTVLLFNIIEGYSASSLTALFTSLFIYILGIRNQLTNIFSNFTAQYLGKISYSLYLMHPIVGWQAISLGKRVLGPNLDPLQGILVFCFGVFVSISVAHIVYSMVEKPSVIFCSRFKKNSSPNKL
jgi:peptidoglycan/LPS O-acetylase OafA/YrhL